MTEAERAHVAAAAADAVAFLKRHEVRRLAAIAGGPRAMRTPARFNPNQLAEAYRREKLRNPRAGRSAA